MQVSFPFMAFDPKAENGFKNLEKWDMRFFQFTKKCIFLISKVIKYIDLSTWLGILLLCIRINFTKIK